MGAKIKGAGSNKIEIEGVKKLKDVSYNIMPDRIETGTFLCLAAISGGHLILENVDSSHIVPIIDKLEETGCNIQINKDKMEILAPKKLKAIDIKTMPYPGFPTDMQSIFATTLTVAKGTSIIVENIFENRYKYTQELIRMGAKISIEGKTAIIKGVRKIYGVAKGTSIIVENIFENRYKYTQELIRMGAKISIEGKTAIIKGVRKIYGATVKATDLRGGAAMRINTNGGKNLNRRKNGNYKRCKKDIWSNCKSNRFKRRSSNGISRNSCKRKNNNRKY